MKTGGNEILNGAVKRCVDDFMLSKIMKDENLKQRRFSRVTVERGYGNSMVRKFMRNENLEREIFGVTCIGIA